MKRIYLVLMGLLCSMITNAQPRLNIKEISAYPLGVSCNKTANIIFPYNIVSVDRGSGSVLAQKALGVGNILQLKADTAYFKATNVSVVTADAKFYSFLLHYVDDPVTINLQIMPDCASSLLKLTGLVVGKADFEKIEKDIIASESFIGKSTKAQKMKLTLQRIYLKDSLLLLGIHIDNKSAIDYPIERIRFYIKDRKRSKRTSIQEIEYTPVYNTTRKSVGGMQEVDLVFAFNPFTYRNNQQLIIQMTEAGGGRNLVLAVKSKTLLRVRFL